MNVLRSSTQMLIPNRLMRCQQRLSFPLPLPTSSSSTPYVAHGDPFRVNGYARDWAFARAQIFIGGGGFGSIRVRSDHHLGFCACHCDLQLRRCEEKVAREMRTKAVNCVATAAAAANGKCRSANAVNANIIIVDAGVAGPSNSLSLLCLFFLSRQPNSALNISFFFFFFLNYEKSAKVYGFASTLACYVHFVKEINMLIIEFQIQQVG